MWSFPRVQPAVLDDDDDNDAGNDDNDNSYYGECGSACQPYFLPSHLTYLPIHSAVCMQQSPQGA